MKLTNEQIEGSAVQSEGWTKATDCECEFHWSSGGFLWPASKALQVAGFEYPTEEFGGNDKYLESSGLDMYDILNEMFLKKISDFKYIELKNSTSYTFAIDSGYGFLVADIFRSYKTEETSWQIPN